MKEIIQKLQVEKKELSDKLKRLDSFIMSDNFDKVNYTQQELLGDQREVMSSYVDILEARIQNLS